MLEVPDHSARYEQSLRELCKEIGINPPLEKPDPFAEKERARKRELAEQWMRQQEAWNEKSTLQKRLYYACGAFIYIGFLAIIYAVNIFPLAYLSAVGALIVHGLWKWIRSRRRPIPR